MNAGPARFSTRLHLGLAVLLALAGACGRNDPGGPAPGTGLQVRISASPRGADAPALGPVDSIRVDLRGPANELLVHPSLMEVAPGQTTFSLAMEAPTGPDRSLTVMAIGSRPVSGGGEGESGRGVLFHGRTTGIDIVAGHVPTIPVTLGIFVPAFLPPEDNGNEAAHVIRWNPVPGADRYLLSRLGSRGGRADSTVLGTSFTGAERPMRYQVRAVDFSGLLSAPSDYLVIGAAEAPDLCVSTASMDLGSSGTSGGFTLTNCGTGGVLEWSVTDDQPWLTVNPPSGTTTSETETIAIQANRTGLPPGVHDGLITITSNGGSGQVTVSLTVDAVPALCLSATTLDLGTAGTSGTVNVTNCGTGTLSWSAADDQPWITVTPGSGTTTIEQDAVTISVNRSGLVPGAHEGVVSFTSNGGSASVQVHIEVAAVPVACVDPSTSIDFQANVNSRTLAIENCGTGGVLSWTLVDSEPWLTLNPVGGTTTNETDMVTVTVNRAGRPPGNYDGTITLTSNGGERTIAVTMTVPAVPALCVSPEGLNFGSAANSLSLFITNCGTGGTLYWSLVGDKPWIGMSGSRSDTTTTEIDSLLIVVDRTGLPPGAYTGAVTVTAGNQVVTVPVTMTVPEVPQLCALPRNLDFGLTSNALSFEITNCGTGGTLNWSLQADQPWIGVTPGSGNTTTEFDEVTVTVNRSGLGPGTHTGKITISSNGGTGTETIDVSLMVSAEPVLCIEPASLNFGLTTIHLTFNLTNCGLGGVLSWSTDGNQPWIQVTPAEGTTTTERDIVTVSVARGQLPGGSYAGTVYVTSNGGVDSIQVAMQIPITPALCVNKTSIDFGSSATQDGFAITNCGTGGTLSWSVTDDRPWITVTPPSGNTTSGSSGVTVIVSRVGLNTGTYTGTVTVSSNGGTANISISLQVPATAALCANPDALDFGLNATQTSFNITNCGNGGRLDWSISHDIPWLAVTPERGSITTETAFITVSVSRSNLDPGTYEGALRVSSNAGAATLPVVMEVAPAIPEAPSGLKATSDQRAYVIHLTWTDNSVNESGFVIERQTQRLVFQVLATVPPNTTAYSDSVNCTSYSYRVRAFTAAGSSGYSNETPFVQAAPCIRPD